MKTILLLSSSLMLNACATTEVLERARGERIGHEPLPAYWALLPLTVPFDVVTFPFQLVVLGANLD